MPQYETTGGLEVFEIEQFTTYLEQWLHKYREDVIPSLEDAEGDDEYVVERQRAYDWVDELRRYVQGIRDRMDMPPFIRTVPSLPEGEDIAKYDDGEAFAGDNVDRYNCFIRNLIQYIRKQTA